MTFSRKTIPIFFTCLLFTASLSAQLRLVEINKKLGIETSQGQIVISPIYQNIGWPFRQYLFKEQVIGYQINGLWGLMDSTGRRVTLPIYSHIEYWGKGHILVVQNLRARRESIHGLIDPSGKSIIPMEYAELKKLSDNAILAKKKIGVTLKTGIIDFNNNIVLPLAYWSLQHFENDAYIAFNSEKKGALYSLSQKRFISEPAYDSLVILKPNHYLAYTGGWAKLMDANGRWLIAEIKPRIVNTDSGIYYRDFVNWEIINVSNQIIRKLAFDKLEPAHAGVYLATQSGKQAFVDQEGKPLHPYLDKIEFRKAQDFHKVLKNGLWGLMNTKGQFLVDAQFIDVRQSGPYIAGYNGANWLIYNLEGKLITDLEFEDVGEASEGFLSIKKRGKWGFINKKGEQITSCIYERADRFQYQLSKVRFYGEEGMINSKGQWVLMPSYKSIQILTPNLFITQNSSGYFAIQDTSRKYFETTDRLSLYDALLLKTSVNGKKGLCTWLGKDVLPTEYDSISPLLQDSVRIVFQQGKIGVIDSRGRFLIQPTTRFKSIEDFNEGFLAVKIGSKEGFVDLDAKLRIANRYEKVMRYQEGLAPVKLLGQWALIDKNERLVSQPNFDWIEGFQQGLSLVRKDNRFGIIDKTGKQTLSVEYDSIRRAHQGYFITYKNKKIGLADKHGRLSQTNKFDYLEEVDNGLFKVEKRTKFGVVDLQGIDKIPAIYDVIIQDSDPDQFITLIRSGWKKL